MIIPGSCHDCHWMTWSMTKHKSPRINPNAGGPCKFNIEPILAQFPRCCETNWDGKLNIRKAYIHYSTVRTNCPCWKKKEACLTN